MQRISGLIGGYGLAFLLALAFCALGLVLIKLAPSFHPLAVFGVLVGVYTVLALSLLDDDEPTAPKARDELPPRTGRRRRAAS
ncbi:hypothetical protein GCM10008171_23070 [Methylopila jiangsuensis]|uniref:Uncharacterized protein n=1 Tax=Methylopila jiangsuensis TaxID=586230 RepID=A0A9W6N469_9HYPH|nr:hypothetical protein [Methylopila jiangsuensis]MDR6286607.1 hypothetical protein [Methylopila jiangsuensis]GLK77053.1 hypothetical protein GCM10008171_23070 [Methylopila jiangsuensis]